ncbi:hypothetical protein L1049_003187 [Liquidambar formosana]|uniref:Uncharacterized protein n=1 Tax=Liquidambar formosana TaxID=63359 RepID=A0AAP0NM15_LIQFO
MYDNIEGLVSGWWFLGNGFVIEAMTLCMGLLQVIDGNIRACLVEREWIYLFIYFWFKKLNILVEGERDYDEEEDDFFYRKELKRIDRETIINDTSKSRSLRGN